MPLNHRLFFLFLFFLFVIGLSKGYSQTVQIPDSLKNHSYQELENKISQHTTNNTKKAEIYANTFLLKARREKDTLKVADGYSLLIELHTYSNPKKAAEYADSLIDITKDWKHKKYLAYAYLKKGIGLYCISKYSESLENYLIAQDLYLKQRDAFGQMIIRHYIGFLKIQVNQKQEALNLFKQNLSFFNKEENKVKYKEQYLKGLFALADTYNEMEIPDSALIYNRIGVIESKKAKSKLYPFFLTSYGQSNKLQGNYTIAIDSLLKATTMISGKKKYLCIIYNSLSDSYRSLGDVVSSVKYLKKIDSVYQKSPEAINEAKKAYEKLLAYYKEKKDAKNQLNIFYKLLEVNNILKGSQEYLSNQIIKEYDTHILLDEKRKLITQLEEKSNIRALWIWIMVVFCVLLFIGSVIYIRWRNKIYKQRFKEIMEKDRLSEIEPKNNGIHKQVNQSIMDDEVVEDVLKKLRDFEKRQGYLDQDISVHKLADKLNTNTNYLSKIVNSYKEKNFAQYINDLRIDYVVSQLKHNKEYRKYTIKAIAGESGFKSYSPFSIAFYKKTGIKPSYFMDRLRSEPLEMN